MWCGVRDVVRGVKEQLTFPLVLPSVLLLLLLRDSLNPLDGLLSDLVSDLLAAFDPSLLDRPPCSSLGESRCELLPSLPERLLLPSSDTLGGCGDFLGGCGDFLAVNGDFLA